MGEGPLMPDVRVRYEAGSEGKLDEKDYRGFIGR